MLKGITFRIYPTKEQQALINQTFGCCRLIYNKCLDLRKTTFKNGGKVGYKETSKMLTELKKTEGYEFLKMPDSVALQQALRNLDTAYQNFFKKIANYPTFKEKT